MKLLHSFALILTALYLTFTPRARAFEHPGGLHTKSQIAVVREKIIAEQQPWLDAYNALIEKAETNLEKPSNALKIFDVPGYYDDAEGHRAAMKRLSTDAWTAYSCAMAYQLTPGKERKRFAKKALYILNDWAKKNKATANYDGELAMADAGIGLVLAAELMIDYRKWRKRDRRKFGNWLNTVYLASADSIIQKENNWGDWGALGCIASHYFLDDADGVARDVEFLYKKIDHEIESDGSMPLETKRGSNGIWYTYFALAPLTAACHIGDNASGSDFFSFKGQDGGGIEEALDYLLIYCNNPKSWPHYSEQDLSLPKPNSWPGNLFEAMYRIYGKKEYELWIEKARPLMSYGHHYAWSFPTLFYVEAVTCDDF
jgi:hypothetical protein